jgi:hypothetical protein
MTINQQNGGQGRFWAPIVVLFAALTIAAGLGIPPSLGASVVGPGGALALTWLIIALLMLTVMAITGLSLGKGPGGILIDPTTNMMSLSRLQIVLWTWVILSAFTTVALARVGDSIAHSGSYGDPLGIRLPVLLWALMGISVSSAVGSPLLKTAKIQRTEADDQRRERQASMQSDRGEPASAATYAKALRNITRDDPETAAATESKGAIVKKKHWRLARFSDVFMGEEVSNFEYVDVSKVQNSFFTMVAVVAYGVALVVEMATVSSIASFSAFPDLPDALVALIGISHAGYLTDKAFTHSTPETD